MFRPSLVAVLVLLGATSVARAQTFTLAVVESANADRKEVTVQHNVLEYVQVLERVVIEVNGKQEIREVTRIVPKTVTVQRRVMLGNVTAYSGAGKKLDPAEVLKQLKPGSVVVLGMPELASKKFAGVFAPDAMLLLSDAPAGGPDRPVPVPVPAPPVPFEGPKGF